MFLSRSSLRRVAAKNEVLASILVRTITGYCDKIDINRLKVIKSQNLKEKTPLEELRFGHTFTDHMLVVDWNKTTGWGAPTISEYGNFSLSPAISSLHYGLQCFEGTKAYKDANGKIRLFRPDRNLDRMDDSMRRLAFPSLDKEGFLECIKELIRIVESWVPSKRGYSLYIRPTAIATSPYLGVHASDDVRLYCILCPVGPYYATGAAVPVKLLADPDHVRAWPGGVGCQKVGGNYAPTIQIATIAQRKGYSQMLWLFGPNHEITEVGAMNIFFLLKSDKEHPDVAGLELVTPSLARGDILPGVTRRSILELCRSHYAVELQRYWGRKFEVSERVISMSEIEEAERSGRLVEAFGAGTAAVVSPVSAIGYRHREIKIPNGVEAGECAISAFAPNRDPEPKSLALLLLKKLNDIQYGREAHPWSTVI